MATTQLVIVLNVDNAAFEDNALEASRILVKLGAHEAERLQRLHEEGLLRDVNGNVVGGWGVRPSLA